MSSIYVVCWIFLQTFQTYILHIGKQFRPRSDWYPLNAQRWIWSDWADAQADLSSLGAHAILLFFFFKRWHKYLLEPQLKKCTFGHVRPAKFQISLRISEVWPESSLGTFWIAKDAKFLQADKEESHQTARMRKLIWVFVRRINQKVRFLMLRQNITKTYLCNFDPLKLHFYIVKLGLTGVYIIFLISSQKHRLWVLVRTASPRRF